MKLKRSYSFLIYGLPVLTLGLWVAKLQGEFLKGQRIELPVVGFDPRDLLSGHYVQYKWDLGIKDPCPRKAQGGDVQDICLCWQSGDVTSLAWAQECKDVTASCDWLMRGRCEGGQFMAGIERFYVPETDARFLDRIPDGSKLVVRLTKDGRSFAEELKPAGLPYDAWIQTKKTATSE